MIPHPEYWLIAVNPRNWPFGQYEVECYQFRFFSRDAMMVAYRETKLWHPDLFFFSVVARYRPSIAADQSEASRED